MGRLATEKFQCRIAGHKHIRLWNERTSVVVIT